MKDFITEMLEAGEDLKKEQEEQRRQMRKAQAKHRRR